MNLFDTPSHPYTVGLLSSLPRHGQERLEPIVGSPPNMLQPPSGCAFRARCTFATDACAVDVLPEVVQHGESMSACIRVNEIDLAVTV
jgi:oligopeptide/dipeptide ABC transporter ATP-binding protein